MATQPDRISCSLQSQLPRQIINHCGTLQAHLLVTDTTDKGWQGQWRPPRTTLHFRISLERSSCPLKSEVLALWVIYIKFMSLNSDFGCPTWVSRWLLCFLRYCRKQAFSIIGISLHLWLLIRLPNLSFVRSHANSPQTGFTPDIVTWKFCQLIPYLTKRQRMGECGLNACGVSCLPSWPKTESEAQMRTK